MSKYELGLITLLLALVCPFTTLVLGWWGGAVLTMNGLLPFGEPGIAVCALAGLSLGLLLDVLYLPRCVRGFYRVRLVFLVPVYLFWSAMAAAFFMGMPFGNLALGTAAGAYMGRRAVLSGATGSGLRQLQRRTAGLTTAVTSAWAVPFALLALQEGIVVSTIQSLLGWSQTVTTAAPGVALMLAVCLGVALLQFQLTELAVRLCYGTGQPVA